MYKWKKGTLCTIVFICADMYRYVPAIHADMPEKVFPQYAVWWVGVLAFGRRQMDAFQRREASKRSGMCPAGELNWHRLLWRPVAQRSQRLCILARETVLSLLARSTERECPRPGSRGVAAHECHASWREGDDAHHGAQTFPPYHVGHTYSLDSTIQS